METMTQREAARRGLTRFYTGRSCHRGHYAERYVAGGRCCECAREDENAKYQEIRELRRKAREGAIDG